MAAIWKSDVAAFMVEQLESSTSVHKAPTLFV